MNHLAFALAVVAAGVGLSGHATAGTVERNYASHGTDNCQAALPVFDDNMRKRPKALANEGTTTAFITCDFQSDTVLGVAKVSKVSITFINRTATDVTVNCTLVDGYYDYNFKVSETKSVVAPASQAFVSIDWTGGTKFYAPATSCALPPGVEIGAVETIYTEDVGA